MSSVGGLSCVFKGVFYISYARAEISCEAAVWAVLTHPF